MKLLTDSADPSEFLHAVLKKKRSKNQAFSLRQFSRQIGIPAASLSNVLTGKRHFSSRMLAAIGRNLELNPLEMERLISLGATSRSNEISLLERVRDRKKVARKFSVTPDTFAGLNSWYSLALVEALGLRKYQSNIPLLAETLGFPLKKAETEIARLIHLGVLERSPDGRVVKKELHVLVTADSPKSVLRSYHRQMLAKAMEAIRAETTDERYLASELFPFSKTDLPEAREIINRCLDELIALSGRSRNPSTVYQVGVQFFDLLRKKEEARSVAS